MNRRILVTGSLLVAMLVGLGIFLAQLFPANQPVQQSEARTQKKPAQNSKKDEAAEPVPAHGIYQSYTEAAFTATQENRRILFFHASWCQQCQKLDKAISANTLPSDIFIFKVDYDSSTSLRAKYGITLQTTFVEVDSAGNKVSSVVAYNEPTYENLSQHFKFTTKQP